MRNKYISIELIFSLVIFTFASLGLLYSPNWLVLGYILHGVWDILHHTKFIQTSNKVVPAILYSCRFCCRYIYIYLSY
ncbi:DUF6010 family protein [Aeribacillus alveayuensis]|uniref:DUF6010 family protein n=1 Tax=Aeribacillus alveayuensis TaxID=279215 RepID=UPI003AF27E51